MILHLAIEEQLASDIRVHARELGFPLSGITRAVTSQGHHHLIKWIESGYAAGMDYFADRLDAYKHPEGVLAGVKSIVVLAMPYPAAADPEVPDEGVPKIARYTWLGDDYHDVIHPKLKALCRLIVETIPSASARGVVDTAPILEREVAQLAGLGWRGKNTLLLNKHLGSYFFLSCVLTDVELPADTPHDGSHCGTCTACLDACPTDAFPQPGVLDASRCISYLTIEHRGSIPLELRDGIGNWLFGCDVCQEVCPWNHRRARRELDSESKRMVAMKPESFFDLDDEEFRTLFRKTPFWRSRRRGMMRNAAIVLGNQMKREAIPALRKGLQDDDPVIQEACRWAIEKMEAETR